ncbi:MAG: NADPH:quinone oxidoreductase family protein [Rhodospirillaceae bacterium]|nr:NADPH:quinone oxidoreductase family protein [Rhodospirillaceae bacterium]MCY4238230.1 NADPH:quinone oxidoreductase family protein [Rhodospirillaceae bacterium]
MRAIVINEFGPIDSHMVMDVPDPEIGPGEVLIENHAIGINFPDVLMMQGRYQKRPNRPFVPGRDCAGYVKAVGEGVTRCKPGDRIVAQVFKGGFGQMVPAPERRCFQLPDSVSFEDAAAMITVFNTAWVAVSLRAQVQPGDTVMVTGAAGGVGSAAVQLCKARGAIVLAAVSSAKKGDFSRNCGADGLVDSNAADATALKTHLKQQVTRLTGAAEGRGCDVVIDMVGGDLFEASLRVLRFGGKLVIVGFADGAIPAAKTNYLLYNNLTIMGAPLDIQFDNVYADMEKGVNTWLGLMAAGKLKSNISAFYDLDEFVAAFSQITERKVKGKILLLPR